MTVGAQYNLLLGFVHGVRRVEVGCGADINLYLGRTKHC